MTALLASVRNLTEAKLAVDAGCDWLDLKEPKAGALGAVPVNVISEVVRRYQGQLPISATIGDCWNTPNVIPARVEAFAATGVDYLKLGLFVDRITGELERALCAAITVMPNLIAVCFAEAPPTEGDVARLAALGFKGVMLDTADKLRGALPQWLEFAALKGFVAAARRERLLVGLAGGLRASDIAQLLPLGADYLGFRSALCAGQRTEALDSNAIVNIRSLLGRVIHEESNHGLARA